MTQKTKNKNTGGFSHHPTDEMIATFSRLSCEEKLKWLSDALIFLYATANPRAKKTWQRLRKGEVL